MKPFTEIEKEQDVLEKKMSDDSKRLFTFLKENVGQTFTETEIREKFGKNFLLPIYFIHNTLFHTEYIKHKWVGLEKCEKYWWYSKEVDIMKIGFILTVLFFITLMITIKILETQK